MYKVTGSLFLTVFVHLYMVASKYFWNYFVSEKYSHLCYISFVIVPLCSYTFLPVTVKVLETLLEASLGKPFQLFCCILNDVSSIINVLSIQW